MQYKDFLLIHLNVIEGHLHSIGILPLHSLTSTDTKSLAIGSVLWYLYAIYYLP